MSKSKSLAWCMWIIASIFYSYQYTLRVIPNVIMNDIMQKFNMDAALYGQFSGIYYIGYCLLHIPIGIMLDRIGPKKVIPFCIFLTTLGLAPILFAESSIYPIIGRFLTGIGSSAAILGAFKIIKLFFDDAKFTRMLSLSVTIGLIGAIYGGGPVSYMCENLGYKAVIEIFIVIGFILMSSIYFLVPEIKSETNEKSIFKDLQVVITNPKIIFSCIFAGLMVGPLEGFADVWGSQYLKQAFDFDSHKASYMTSIIFIGMCFGAPSISFIAEKTNRYIGTIILAAITMALIFISLLSNTLNEYSMSISFAIIGICSAYQIIAIYKISTFAPRHVSSLAAAIANMIIMSFGYGFHSAIGNIVNVFGGPQNIIALKYGIAVIPIGLIIGAFGYLVIAYFEKQNSKKIELSIQSQ
jgi:predicted MFS family arabinose efflux permease